MGQENFVSITISLPKAYRDQLRRIAAEASLKNPEEFTSISQLGRKIICRYLDDLRENNTPKAPGGTKNG